MSKYDSLRNRVKDSMKRLPDGKWWNYQNTVNWKTSIYTGTYKSMWDAPIKDFRRRSAKGEILMHPMSSYAISVESAQLSDLHQYNGSSTYWSKQSGNFAWQDCNWSIDKLANPPDPYGSIGRDQIVKAAELASTRVLSQIGRGSTNMWENLAEIDKTVATLWKPINSWYKFDRKARIATAGLSAANAWLMYRYGIKPLIGSIDDVTKALQREIRPDRAFTRAKETLSTSSTQTAAYDDSWYIHDYGIQKTETHEVRALSVDEIVLDMYHDIGISSKDLLTLPWELIPYSFVVDWFANVGDYFGALASFLNPRNLGSCLVQTDVLSETRTKSGQRASYGRNGVVVTPSLSWVRRDAVFKNRLLGLTRPVLHVKFDYRFDRAERVGDAISLISQSLLRRFT